jgi:hypothetical protein
VHTCGMWLVLCWTLLFDEIVQAVRAVLLCVIHKKKNLKQGGVRTGFLNHRYRGGSCQQSDFFFDLSFYDKVFQLIW